MKREELLAYNRMAWNEQVVRCNRWTVPVDPGAIERARSGRPEIVLTPTKQVPFEWFPPLKACPTLMLASGGGQQAPLLAAAGADVTVVDLSDQQLEQDRLVADRDELTLRTVRASMDDLSVLEDEVFDLVIHPCSNSFVPDLRPVWSEIARVTRPGATLMTGFCNPLIFLFDESKMREGVLKVAYQLPYSDEDSLSAKAFEQLRADREPLMYGHTLTEQIGGQLAAGFTMRSMYEDCWLNDEELGGYQLLNKFTSSFVATLCERLPRSSGEASAFSPPATS